MATESAEHDPTGLDLARQVAASIGASSTGRRRRPKRKRTEGQVSGAHPDDRDPQLLGRAMDRLMDSKGWTAEVNVHTILGRWQVLVGPMMAQHTTPESYRDNVITVRATSTAWATQLRGLAPRIVASLNEQLGQGTVERITVLGPDVPSWNHGRRRVHGGRGPRDTYG
ncbi:MAG TPA: DUF721 domain-containing protein [Candidatus Avipropionibacterium avicola]|uniref:DUF721 domain-containing protein n=1 Tax=Candidatus Avipropionibacterium avicola TaxID=2840701 RepID=A0A9D1GVA2_9ACTN|nr:DUF721 domain-containing protein [Candidatus Avipropionibacterium avicola]